MPQPSSPNLTHKSRQPGLPQKRRWGITAFVAIAATLCTGASSPSGCNNSSSGLGNIGPSNGEIIGAAVGIGAVVAVAIIVPVEISRSHHILTGCVVTGPNGLELQTSDSKTYSLEGDAATSKLAIRSSSTGQRSRRPKTAQDLAYSKWST